MGIVGCGNIGKTIAEAIDKNKVKANLVALSDKHKDKAKNLKQSLKSSPKILDTNSLIKECDLVIEAASIGAVKEIAIKALREECQLMLMSVGALAQKELREKIIELANKNNTSVYLPSGAICGLDGIKSASSASLEEVKIRTIKPPESLKDAPGAKDLDELNKKKIIFEEVLLRQSNYFQKT